MHTQAQTRASWTRRAAIALAVGALAGLGGAVVTVPTGEAEAAISFTATASAEGVRVAPFAGGAPVTNEPANGGSPVAEATLDSLGSSLAFASAIYPGDFLVSLPGLVAGVSNGQLTLPGYPLIANSDRTITPEHEVAVPGITMRAKSSDTSSEASAVMGGAAGNDPVGQVSATTLVQQAETGDVRATSRSLVAGIFLEPLKIATMRSEATAGVGADGTLQRSSSFEITGMEVGGVPVKLGPQGLTVADTDTALPATADIQTALSEAGIEVRFLEAVEFSEGVLGQGMEISIIRETGAGVTPVGVTLRFGRAMALAGGAADPLVPDVGLPPTGSGPPPDQALSPDPGPPAPSVGGTGAASGQLPLVPAVSGGLQDTIPSRLTTSGGAGVSLPAIGDPAVTSNSPVVEPGSPAPELSLARPALAGQQFNTRNLYPLLAGVAALAGIGVLLVALLGLRSS